MCANLCPPQQRWVGQKCDVHRSRQPVITRQTSRRELLILRNNKNRFFVKSSFSFVQVVVFAMTITWPLMMMPIRHSHSEEDEDCQECQQPLDLSMRGCQDEDNNRRESFLWPSLKDFAVEFKTRRVEMGRTQGDVGRDLGRCFGHDFSQTTISRFEALNLSLTNMIKLKPILEIWLDDPHCASKASLHPPLTWSSSNHHLSVFSTKRRRRPRTSLDARIRTTLEASFQENKSPKRGEIASLALALGIDRDVARVWFCNRYVKIAIKN